MKKLITFLSALFIIATGYSQTVIWEENFDTASIGKGYEQFAPGVPFFQSNLASYPGTPWTVTNTGVNWTNNSVFSVQNVSASDNAFEIKEYNVTTATSAVIWFTDAIDVNDPAINTYKGSLELFWSGSFNANDFFEVTFSDGGQDFTITKTGADLNLETSPIVLESPNYSSKDDMYITVSAANSSSTSMFFDNVKVEEVIIALPYTDIYDIQYTTIPGDDGTYPSLLLGTTVFVQGTVTGTNTGGYYIQQEDGFDGDNALPVDNSAWTGIYVSDSYITPSAGDIVEVTGEVVEVLGKTEISVTGANSAIIGGGDAIIPNMIYSPLEEKYESVLITARAFRVVFNDIDNLVYPNVASIIGIGEGLTHAYEILVDKDLDDLDVFPSNKDKLFDYIYGVCNYYSNTYRISPRDITDFSTSSSTIITSATTNSINESSVLAIQSNVILISDANALASIYNLSGQLVKELNIQSGRTEVEMPSGVYIVKLNDGNNLITEKVMVN